MWRSLLTAQPESQRLVLHRRRPNQERNDPLVIHQDLAEIVERHLFAQPVRRCHQPPRFSAMRKGVLSQCIEPMDNCEVKPRAHVVLIDQDGHALYLLSLDTSDGAVVAVQDLADEAEVFWLVFRELYLDWNFAVAFPESAAFTEVGTKHCIEYTRGVAKHNRVHPESELLFAND